MAPRHWLDPLARRLLIATGQIPAPKQVASRREAEALAARQVEREVALDAELEALKRRQGPGLVDVNRATASDWRQLPGCTAEQVDLLMRLQAGGVQLCGPEDLAEVLRLEPQVLREWLPRLVFHWYGEPPPLPPAPVAINRASAAELRERLALSGQRLTRLRAERARSPFRDLADLQERLALPAAQVEAWIGRLSFDPPDPAAAKATEGAEGRSPREPRGPSLPPTPSRGRAGSAAPQRRRP